MGKEYHIEIDGVKIPVSEEVYYAFKRPAWREHKRAKVRSEKELSVEAFTESGYDIPSKEPLLDEIVADKLLLDQLLSALAELTDDERALIDSIYFQEKTAREYARKIGTNHTNVNRKHKGILEKLRELLKNYL